jgi:3-hydroxyisobutyrate dehydrogenase
MGSAMARVLLGDGFPLRVFDPRPDRVAALVAEGAVAAASPAEAAKGADLLCSSLPDGPSLLDAYLGGGQALAHLAPGTVIVDFSTTEPAAIRQLDQAAIARGIEVVDAPVSGGPPDVPARQLLILVGASDSALARAEPLLDALSGGRIQRTGAVGTARLVKLVNNVMFLGNLLVAAEAFTLGVKAGVDAGLLFEVLSQSGGRSHHFLKRFPWALQRDFAPRFAMTTGLKDLRLALGLAREEGVPMPTAAVGEQLYAAAAALGYAQDDAVAILRLFEGWAGVQADARPPSDHPG